ncbi:WAT1-related protein [Citrus sinensis]|nr:WAT1-related protein [Citrus sinensis]
MGMGVKQLVVGLVPYAAMVAVQCVQVGITTLSKAAISQGATPLILAVYADAIASLILLPLSFFLNRKNRPPLTFALLCKVFILSLIGITLMQICVYTGVSFSSPTLASATNNLIPAFTFLLAVIFRMEKVDLRSLISQIKIIGTLVSIAGAFIITLYKGPSIVALLFEHQPKPQPPTSFTLLATTDNWAIGGILLSIASFSIAAGNIFQCAIVALIAERNPDAWRIRPGIELITVMHTAIFGGLMLFGLVAWCLRRKGPVFVAMFNPVGIFIAALMSDIFLGDTLHLGSVIGAIIIVTGFYGVMWAQSKEEEKIQANTDGQFVFVYVDARFWLSSFYDQGLCSINFTTTRISPRKAFSPEVPAHTDRSEHAGCFPGANPSTLKSDMKVRGTLATNLMAIRLPLSPDLPQFTPVILPTFGCGFPISVVVGGCVAFVPRFSGWRACLANCR